jgi:hypothetical protein
VSALPARLPRRVRLARALGLDHNPLRRRTDRVLAWFRIAMVAVFLAGGPLAATAAGNWMHGAAVSEARVQAAAKHSTGAVLLQRSPLLPPPIVGMLRAGSQTPVLARWKGADGAARTGEVLARPGLAAGSPVTIWLSDSGQLTAPPLQPDQITERTVATALLALAVLALLVLAVLRLARAIADRRRLAAWDAAWTAVAPEWTRRR